MGFIDLLSFVDDMVKKGRAMESGEFEYHGRLYTYKIKELKRKPKPDNQMENK